MYVTPPSTTSTILRGDRRLSAHAAGIGTALQRRSEVPGLPVRAALAAGLCLSGLRRWRAGDPPRSVALQPLRAGDLGDGGDDFPRQQTALDDLVARHVARDFAEERRQRAGFAAGAGSGQLQDRLVAVAQAATGDGQTGAGSFERS